MAVLKSTDFEIAPNGTALTAGNTGYTSIGGTAGTAASVSDNTWSETGIYSARFITNLTTRYAYFTVTPVGYMIQGAQFKFNTLPLTTVPLLGFRLVGVGVASIRLGTTGALSIRNANAGLQYTMTNLITAGQEVWLEHEVDSLNVRQKLKMYGSDGVLIEDSGYQLYTASNIDEVQLGCNSSSSIDYYVDRHIIDDLNPIGAFAQAAFAPVAKDSIQVNTYNWLAYLGYTAGSLHDRQMAFLRAKYITNYGALPAYSLSSADLQLALGRPQARFVLRQNEWS